MPDSLAAMAKKAGLPPGSLVYLGDKGYLPAKITIMEYDENRLQEREATSWHECPVIDRSMVTWIKVNGFAQVENLEKLGECFRLHPLVLEDVLDINQRPKIEDYEDYLYIIVRSIQAAAATGRIDTEQISIILGANYVISFEESDGDVLAPVRDRLITARGRLRKLGADYLAYALIDVIVDNYFVVLEQLGDQVEAMEDEVVTRPTPETLQGVHQFKNDMLMLRKALWPLREVISRLERRESPLVSEDLTLYFKDVYDHTVIAIDTVETYRDILAGLLDVYLSSVSNRLNQIMKVLTIIATIFMPLTFLTGIFGMNFKYLPGLDWDYGYFTALGFMTVIAMSMLWYFKKRQWI